MSPRTRLDRLQKRLDADRPAGPLTVVLIEAAPGQQPGRRERTNSAGLPVLDVAYDPETGPPQLPPAPYKLVHGVDPVDLV